MNPDLEAMLNEVLADGLDKAIINRCYDRGFCKMFNLDYTSDRLYADIYSLMQEYIVFPDKYGE